VKARRNGADQSNSVLIAREPFQGGAMIATQTWMTRKRKNIRSWRGPGRTNQSTRTGGSRKSGKRTERRVYIAKPPSQLSMPNQPQATIARRMAATLAPQTPKDARTKTGKGMPYLAPTCELRRSGTVTMALPRMTVRTAVVQWKPKTRPTLARLQEGMTTQVPTQKAR
jgi:hypothetical protein